MLWGSVSVNSVFSHRVLSNVECSKIMLPLPDCHSHTCEWSFLFHPTLPTSARSLRSLLQLRFLRLQSFSPSECQDENPADQGVVVQKRARQCYLWCEANDHVGMTVLFQTWPNLDRNCPWLLGSLATPTVEVQPSWSGVSIAVVLVNTCINQALQPLNLPTLLHTWSLGN